MLIWVSLRGCLGKTLSFFFPKKASSIFLSGDDGTTAGRGERVRGNKTQTLWNLDENTMTEGGEVLV